MYYDAEAVGFPLPKIFPAPYGAFMVRIETPPIRARLCKTLRNPVKPREPPAPKKPPQRTPKPGAEATRKQGVTGSGDFDPQSDPL